MLSHRRAPTNSKHFNSNYRPSISASVLLSLLATAPINPNASGLILATESIAHPLISLEDATHGM